MTADDDVARRNLISSPPLIITPDEIRFPPDLSDGDTLYRVHTVRQGDPITFAIRAIKDAENGVSLLTIDTVSGDIKVPSVAKLRQFGRSIEISVTATDTAGLSDEKTLTIVLQP